MNLHDLLVNLHDLLVNSLYLLVSLADLLVNSAFTRDQYIWKSIVAADLEVQLRNCLRSGRHF
ncbi:hypothetical protein IFT92_12485 [Peribacillus simplex]|uniref:hypothetical protein n=1 Tax=Peribacillus simplex TaxID=1478 RepID=UPI001157613D|nr:hypothetical protein [Peribacillus simplex]MBD8588614.1 hypothetical protein [Peribacillus simplex]